MAEGAPLLREYTGNGIEGSNPFLSATFAHIPIKLINDRNQLILSGSFGLSLCFGLRDLSPTASFRRSKLQSVLLSARVSAWLAGQAIAPGLLTGLSGLISKVPRLWIIPPREVPGHLLWMPMLQVSLL